jgi:SAM-dependent methyltransferase
MAMFNKNSPSELFLALSQGIAAQNRDVIDSLLKNGALIANGPIITPVKAPKLFTRHANVKNLEIIFRKLLSKLDGNLKSGLFLEIGSGDGYLKYLLSLSDDPGMENLRNRLVETEISPEIVTRNLHHGKYVINAGIHDLVFLFGRECFSAVISFNVLDTFSPPDLVKNLGIIAEVLKPGGIIIHIMSSAIHENVFVELQERFPDRILLPYYEEGHLGFRIISQGHPLTSRHHKSSFPPARYWCDFFAQNPGNFMEVANIISKSCAEFQSLDQIILLKNYSSEKIKAALQPAGFELLGNAETVSVLTVVKDDYHGKFTDINYFHNVLGTLITELNPARDIKPEEIMEKSTYLWVMGRKSFE